MVTTPLVKCFIWFEIALVCKWLSRLQVAARCLNAGFSERQSHNGASFPVSQNIFLLFQQRESDIWQCRLWWHAEKYILVFNMKWYFNEKIHYFHRLIIEIKHTSAQQHFLFFSFGCPVTLHRARKQSFSHLAEALPKAAYLLLATQEIQLLLGDRLSASLEELKWFSINFLDTHLFLFVQDTNQQTTWWHFTIQ